MMSSKRLRLSVDNLENEVSGAGGEELADPNGNVDTSRADGAESLLRFLATSLLLREDDFTIRRSMRGESVRLTLQVPGSDLGKVIGKGGRIANAVRALVQVAGAKNGLETHVEFSDGKRGPSRPGQRRPYGQGGRPKRRPS